MTYARRWIVSLLAAVAPTWLGAQNVASQAQRRDTATKLEIYGFAQADAIYDFRTNNPDWFDVNRPTRLPAFTDEFGRNDNFWFSVRQTRFGVKATIPAKGPDIIAVFDWDLFGVGVDAGQTTIRLRHAYGQWGKFGAGQLESPFMDLDVFPNILDYWGPNGMLFFRNVQVFWEPIKKDNGSRVRVALERPGASGDAGIYRDRIELQNIRTRFPAPDISAEGRYADKKWGYIELAGIVRWIRWDDLLVDAFDLGGGTTGWGLSLSSNINATKKDVIRFQFIGGAGVENYFNDAPLDIGIRNNLGNVVRPIIGVALPDVGISAYLDHTWNKLFSSAIGYARVDIDNSSAQLPRDFRNGQYASANVLYYPQPNIMMGGELQWGRRANFRDDFTFNDYRLQFSFKYIFSQKFGGR